jgi:hypothetical protein
VPMTFCITFATFTFSALVFFVPIVRFIVIKMSTTHGATLFTELKGVLSALYSTNPGKGEVSGTPFVDAPGCDYRP